MGHSCIYPVVIGHILWKSYISVWTTWHYFFFIWNWRGKHHVPWNTANFQLKGLLYPEDCIVNVRGLQLLCQSEHVTVNYCEHESWCMRFEIFTPVLMKVQVLCDVIHCQLVYRDWCIRGASCLYLRCNFGLQRRKDRSSSSSRMMVII